METDGAPNEGNLRRHEKPARCSARKPGEVPRGVLHILAADGRPERGE